MTARAALRETAMRYRHLADQCLAEYDLDGWPAPGLINPDDVNVVARFNESSQAS